MDYNKCLLVQLTYANALTNQLVHVVEVFGLWHITKRYEVQKDQKVTMNYSY